MALVGGSIWPTNTDLSTDTEGGWVLVWRWYIYVIRRRKWIQVTKSSTPRAKSPFPSSYGCSRPLLYAFGRVPSGCSNNEASPNFVSFTFASYVDEYSFLLLPGRLLHLTLSSILGLVKIKVDISRDISVLRSLDP